MKRFLAMTAIALAVAGCQEKEEEIRVLRPLVQWDDVSAVTFTPLDDGYVNLVPAGTDGSFPASLAVARVAVDEQTLQATPRQLTLATRPKNDFLAWNRLFDNLRYLSEAFPLDKHDLGEDPPTPTRLVAAARDLRAGLCLVYGRGDLSESESRVRGVLYDTRTGLALAGIDARASVPDPETLTRPPEDVSSDDSYCDPRVLADRRFERLVLECVRELWSNDRPAAPEAPQEWRPEGPLRPRIWPPLPYGETLRLVPDK